MRVVLPIAAVVAILIAAGAVSGGAKLTDRAPVGLETAAPAGTAPYPVVFDPYTGLGVAELPVAAAPGPEAALPSFEVDPLDPHRWKALTAPSFEKGPLVARAWYGDAPLAVALPATDAWWSDTPPPLDAK